MDRNLGAYTSSIENYQQPVGSIGYQFGRKDPLPMSTRYDVSGQKISTTPFSSFSEVSAKTFPFSVKFPNQKFNGMTDWIESNPYADNPWNTPSWHKTQDGRLNLKSLFDPCPVGWVVPQKGVWTDIHKSANFYTTNHGYADYLNGRGEGEFAWFPISYVGRAGGTHLGVYVWTSTPNGTVYAFGMRNSESQNGGNDETRRGLHANAIRCVQE